jgi:DeoR/GlpR family transcriptional regulator of sugar metabolism
MDAVARINQLAEALRLRGRVDVATAAAEFGAAEMTVRRDLDVLVERGGARRARGGAVNLMMRGEGLPFAMRELDALDTKKRIASDVAGLTAFVAVGTLLSRALRDAPQGPASPARSDGAP